MSADASGPLLARKKAPPGSTTPPPPTDTTTAPAPAPSPTPTPTGATPVFSDGFDTGARSPQQNGYGWTFTQNGADGDAVGISSTVARTGAYSMKFTYGGNANLCDDAFSEQRFTLGENLPEAWFEYYVFIPAGGTAAGTKFYHRSPTCAAENDANGINSNNKFFALWDVDYIDKDVRVMVEYRRSKTAADGDSYMYGMWCSDTRVCSDWGWPGHLWDPAFTDAMKGRWVQVRIHAKVADSKATANGLLEVWVDGALRINMKNLDLAASAGGNNWFRNSYLMGWSNSGFNQTTAVYLDDFKIFRSSPGW
ncbi:MAG TPA: hypothetical protein VGV85_08210 [Longimicrobiaceae bacterium]|nr:hypothetical protein [Longimicrobiaceae bacterium]